MPDRPSRYREDNFCTFFLNTILKRTRKIHEDSKLILQTNITQEKIKDSEEKHFHLFIF